MGGSFVAYSNKAKLKVYFVKRVFEGGTDAERDLFMKRIGKMVGRLDVDAKRKGAVWKQRRPSLISMRDSTRLRQLTTVSMATW